MTSWLKKELKKADKERKKCKKLYQNWVDNEFNCGANEFVFGVIADLGWYKESSQEYKASFNTLNKLQIYYNRNTEKYMLDVEILLNDDQSYENYLDELLKEFKKFVDSEYNRNINNDVNIYIDLNNYLGNYDMINYWSADDLITLYHKFYMFVIGYKQICKNKKQLDKKLEVKYKND